MIRALFWDNDGILVNTEEIYFGATRKVMAREGFDLTLDAYVSLSLVSNQGAWHRLTERGVSVSRIETLRAERNALYAHALETEPIEIPGVDDVLKHLHGRIPMAVVTSSRRDHFDIIHRRTGFLKYFDFVIADGDFQHSKPHPEPYLKALARRGLLAGECLAIEDSERGLTSAKAAGLQCWTIPTALTKGCDFSAADRVLTSIAQVADGVL